MSVADRVADAGVAVIVGLSLGVTPVKRKRLYLLDGENPPAILVAQGPGIAIEALHAVTSSTFKWVVRYPLGVAIASAAGGKVANGATVRDWVDSIWPAIGDYRRLRDAGLTEVNDVRPGNQTPFDGAGLRVQMDWSVMNFEVETLEVR